MNKGSSSLLFARCTTNTSPPPTLNNDDDSYNTNIEWNVSTITGTDYEGYGSDGESANATPFSSPSGIALGCTHSSHMTGSASCDGDGGNCRELLISDHGNNKIRRIKSGIVTTIAGNGQKGFNGDGAVATVSKLNYPTRMARCENGDLYIADRHNHRIRKVSALDGTISTIAGTGREGFNGDGILAIHADLYFPTGIAIDEDEGEIFISDFHNQRIRRISLRTGLIHTVAGFGERGYDGDGGFAIYARIRCPTGIALNKRGDIYFSDSGNNVIRKISTCGIISTVAGTGERGFNGDNMDALDTMLDAPSGLAVNKNGEVYFADLYNNRICKITKDRILCTVAGTYEEGYQDGPANMAKFKNPSDLAIDQDNGDVYVVDGNNRIRKISTTKYLNSGVRMKKFNWDRICGTDIFGVRYLIRVLSPQFYESVVSSDTLIKNMNTTQHEIVQYLIDELIYEPTKNWQDKFDPIDIVSILGLFQGCEFIELKKSLVKGIKKTCNQSNIHLMMEKVEQYKKHSPENFILNQIFEFCIQFAAVLLRDSSCILKHDIILKYITTIAHKISDKTPPRCLLYIHEDASEKKSLSSLLNDRATSDITINVGKQQFYCHKTILASSSVHFEESFGNLHGLKDNYFTLQSGDHEISEMIIKYCYGLLLVSNIKPQQGIPLLNSATFHGMKKLAEFSLSLNKK